VRGGRSKNSSPVAADLSFKVLIGRFMHSYTGVISLIYPVKFTIVRSAAHFTGAKAPPVPLHYAG
jgi:hypothetical protein